MDILFDNPLVRMPGTLFLLLYGTTILLTAVTIMIYKSNIDWTSKLPLPLIPQNPNPFEIAYLRGGENEFARSVVFSLLQKGFLQLSTEGKKSFIVLAQNQPNWTTLSAMERSVLPWFQVTRESKEVFGSNGVTDILKPYSAAYEQKITQSNFIMPNDVAVKTKVLALFAGAALVLSGVYKIITSLLSGYSNIGFTVVLVIVSLIVFGLLGKTSRLSNLGKRYVERIQQAFENLKSQVQSTVNASLNPASTFGAIDPFLLAVGVFGVASLSGTMYHEYEQAFHRANISGGSSSGCGSSCSSGDGGSSCGSGCGGCGGGD